MLFRGRGARALIDLTRAESSGWHAGCSNYEEREGRGKCPTTRSDLAEKEAIPGHRRDSVRELVQLDQLLSKRVLKRPMNLGGAVVVSACCAC